MLISCREIGGEACAANATMSWTARRGVLVEVLDEGVRGFGEASPLAGFSREALDAVKREIAALDGQAIDLASLSSSAAFAVESALLDIEAQRAAVSVAELLAGVACAPVRSSALLGDPRQARGWDPRIDCVKLKVGPAAEWPAQAKALAELALARPRARFRLDFNGSLSASEARSILAEIAERRWPVEFVEDPVAPGELADLASPLDVAVDAIVAAKGARAVRELAARGVCQVAVLKPALLGGLRRTMSIARELAGEVDLVVSHLLDGPVALAACAELACAVATLRPTWRAAGVGPHPALSAFGDVGEPLGSDGWLRPRAR